MRVLITIVFLLYSGGIFAQNSSPIVIGETIKWYSNSLNEEREINIFLPKNYSKSDTIHYPVIYLLDGSVHEDFLHVAGLLHFNQMMGIMPSAILIGIKNVDRKRDFTFPTSIEKDRSAYPTTGHSEKFISYLTQEVQPFVHKTFSAKPRYTTLIGQSLGGLLATEILVKNPSFADRYIIISPSLWWDDQSLLTKLKETLQPTTLSHKMIHIAVGKEHEVMIRDAGEMSDYLKKNTSAKVSYEFLQNEDHATILHQALINVWRLWYKNAAN